ncbi:transmembrane protein adipocyte-associated 1-like [Tachypleus tridentatus]|uniref:transmembrane protein adipocyte-associated 1-like n=1 Tax=Tachypleus tridentatus TaxID=6853 RepID=UPI003FD2B2CA
MELHKAYQILRSLLTEETIIFSMMSRRNDHLIFSSSRKLTSDVTENDQFCRSLLYYKLGNTRVQAWDLALFIPNVLFMVFLVLRINQARQKFKERKIPVLYTVYHLVLLSVCINVVRCMVSMIIDSTSQAWNHADKLLWLLLRLFLLGTEMSVLVFTLTFGQLDRKRSIRMVIGITSSISVVYSLTQTTLEFMKPEKLFYIPNENYGLFSHGGLVFWFVSSLLFFLVYTVILILKWTPVGHRLPLPEKQLFYWYTLFLSLMNFFQAVGCGLFYHELYSGLCVLDVTTYVYFTCFVPFIYQAFLGGFFSSAERSIIFSYKSDMEELVEDNQVSFSCLSIRKNTYLNGENDHLYGSALTDVGNLNPLYVHSIYSSGSSFGLTVSSDPK